MNSKMWTAGVHQAVSRQFCVVFAVVDRPALLSMSSPNRLVDVWRRCPALKGGCQVAVSVLVG